MAKKKMASKSALSPRAQAIIARTKASRASVEAVVAQPDVDVPEAAAMAETMNHRDYQVTAVDELTARLREHKRVVAVGPTGCGKTVIASLLIDRWKSARVLFVVHRYELADQAYKALRSLGIETGMIMAQEERIHGSDRSDLGARVQVASIQTLVRRPVDFPVGMLVLDEAHRALADSYQSIASAHRDAVVLGLTATPERADGKGLGDFFRDLYPIASYSGLRNDRHLADPRWFGARADVVAELTERLRGARVSNGDFAPGDLVRAVDSKLLMGRVIAESLRIAPGVTKVVFAGSVAHSQRLAAAFDRAGVRSAHLDGDTPAKDRESALKRLATGDLEVICNYDVLGEGWDLPDLGAVVLARPFRSLSKYLQVVGRGMRWRPGPRPIIIDHGNNAPRLGVWPGDDVEWSLSGDRVRRGDPLWKQCGSCLERIPLSATACPGCGHECPIERARREHTEAQVDLEEATRAQYMALRTRVEKIAVDKGAPAGWIDEVMHAASAKI